MPYDPQRSHRRPQLADDAPAPIDALLGEGSESETAPSEPEVRSNGATKPDAAHPEVAPTFDYGTTIDVPPEPSRGGARIALVAVATVGLMLLLLAWIRRRR